MLLLAESGGSGDPTLDAADPTGIITWGSDLVYCLQEGLADGGAGLGASWGLEDQRRVLADGGFTVTATHDSRAGYRILRAEPMGWRPGPKTKRGPGGSDRPGPRSRRREEMPVVCAAILAIA